MPVSWWITDGLAVFVTRGYPIVYRSDKPFLRLDKKAGPTAARV
jgi:hypothetical protein